MVDRVVKLWAVYEHEGTRHVFYIFTLGSFDQ